MSDKNTFFSSGASASASASASAGELIVLEDPASLDKSKALGYFAMYWNDVAKTDPDFIHFETLSVKRDALRAKAHGALTAPTEGFIQNGFSRKEARLIKQSKAESLLERKAIAVQETFSPALKEKSRLKDATAMSQVLRGCIKKLADKSSIEEMPHKSFITAADDIASKISIPLFLVKIWYDLDCIKCIDSAINNVIERASTVVCKSTTDRKHYQRLHEKYIRIKEKFHHVLEHRNLCITMISDKDENLHPFTQNILDRHTQCEISFKEAIDLHQMSQFMFSANMSTNKDIHINVAEALVHFDRLLQQPPIAGTILEKFNEISKMNLPDPEAIKKRALEQCIDKAFSGARLNP